jgi:hypothetical protein
VIPKAKMKSGIYRAARGYGDDERDPRGRLWPGDEGATGTGTGITAPPTPTVDSTEQQFEKMKDAVIAAVNRAQPVTVNYTVAPNINEDPLATAERKEDMRRFQNDQMRKMLKERDPEFLYELRRVISEMTQ